MTTISDERLAELIASSKQAVNAGIGHWPYKDNVSQSEVHDILTELQSLRAQGGVRALEWAKAAWSSSDTDYEHIVEIWKAFGAGHIQGWVEEQKDGKFYSDGEQFDTLAEAKAYVQAKHAQTILSSLEASPAPVSEEMSKPTVEQAIESLVAALDEMRSQQAKRDEFLATLIVNIEKNEPTAEFAVNLREYVRNGRAALAAKGGQ